MVKKLSPALLYAAASVCVYLYRDGILAWIGSRETVLPVALAAVLTALFPVIPYPVVGAVIGAAYGPGIGGALTWAGSAAASLLMFGFVRYGYRDAGRKLLRRSGRLDRFTQLFERNAFLMIVFARLLPFIPSIAVNVYAALGRVSFAIYALASSLGKVPAALLFAVIGDSLMLEPGNIAAAALIYGAFLAITLAGYRRWTRKSSAKPSDIREERS
ncbi:TVP38/TMEM64 family protein [Paenibacillus arenilitoris]|uniref:TVP38/TMEM64 family membrane protein n=1 Tax=Paenibacillus arenilitoris TaxID=2772299 RepID=A0A927CNI6_9BACL|nr:TVP38/TMEM64 family protein [Paenibacillus arenilitoris]MBD2870819.1 TVP38/TMEM64 family protein [Paenibacillus arenilitoris]